eukprot:5818325-Amphidinium_carterae.1
MIALALCSKTLCLTLSLRKETARSVLQRDWQMFIGHEVGGHEQRRRGQTYLQVLHILTVVLTRETLGTSPVGHQQYTSLGDAQGVMSVASLSLDSFDVAHSVKCLPRDMQAPTSQHVTKMVRQSDGGH